MKNLFFFEVILGDCGGEQAENEENQVEVNKVFTNHRNITNQEDNIWCKGNTNQIHNQVTDSFSIESIVVEDDGEREYEDQEWNSNIYTCWCAES